MSCVKCHHSKPLDGDTWCAGCSAWEVIGRELGARWNGPLGLRCIADNLVLATAREVRALRSLGAGFPRASGGSGAEPAGQPSTRLAGADTASSTPGLSAKAKPRAPSEESKYTYEYETDTGEETEEDKGVEKATSHRTKGKGPSPPKKERKSEKSARKQVKEEESSEERQEKKLRREQEGSGKEKKRKEESKEEADKKSRRGEASSVKPGDTGGNKHKKKKTKRGGRKHKRLERLSDRPYQKIHRVLDSRVLNLRPGLGEHRGSL